MLLEHCELFMEEMSDREFLEFCWKKAESKDARLHSDSLNRLYELAKSDHKIDYVDFIPIQEHEIKSLCLEAKPYMKEKEKLQIFGKVGTSGEK